MSITADPVDFYRDLAAHAALPFVRLDETATAGDPYQRVDPDVAALLSEIACRHWNMIAVALIQSQVIVASSEPFDDLARQAASALTGLEARFVVAPAEDIEAAIDASFGTREDGPAQTSGISAEEAEQLGVRMPLNLGELLAARGVIDEQQLDQALEEQARTGIRLGEILTSRRLVNEQTIIEVLARQQELPTVDLESFPVDPVALAQLPESLMRTLRCVPIAIDDTTLRVAVSDPLDEPTRAKLHEHTSLELRPMLASPTAIEALLQRLFADDYIETATHEMERRFPEDCANRVVTRAQRVFFIAVAVTLVITLAVFPVPTLVGLMGASCLFYIAVSFYKIYLIYSSLGHEYELDVSDEEIAALDERTLPKYTILVPLFREAAVISQLADGIAELDYPQPLLDVRLLCEADDDETIDRIRELDLPPHFKLVIVPPSQPQTKPKACNYGILLAQGKYVVIYDAEDRPDRDQLKKVVLAFRKGGPSITCVQGKLNYFNRDQNLLTRWFSIEYSAWFDLILPGLDKSGVPIPLGGTSNHFVTERLLELGGWDPYNVTEDCDLGVRLHKAGYKTAIVDSTTLEEANSEAANWVRQRSRWIKGYIQTWLVHTRHPVKLLRELGLKSWLSFHLIVGGTFIFLLNPVFWLLTTGFFFTKAGFIARLFPSFVFYVASTLLFVGNFLFVYLSVAATVQRRNYSLAKYALLLPLYWGLMSLAAWKGFIQLFTNPFFWEKTEHGLNQSTPPASN